MKKVFINIFVSLLVFFSLFTVVFAKEEKELKVLVIEINPIINSIQNKKLYKNNDGHPYVSEYFGFDRNKAVLEIKEDLEEMSHNYLKINIVKKEFLNEFPTYNKEITLIDGKKAYRYDEKTYLAISRDANNKYKGNWYDFIYYPNNKPSDYSFDYEYLIKKFDLINRRNNGEFDQVWLNTIDPSSTFETLMIGKNSYWVNGTPIEKDCPNFIIFNISISRRDANLHALGHSFENILNLVFNDDTWFDYEKKYNDINEEEYNKLNLWEKFSMINSQSNNNNSGVGNVHFPFNAKKDYDYTNKTKVYSYWKNWLNYPNIDGEKELSDSSAWLSFEPNLKLGNDEDKDPDRLYMRFWLYLFPHIEGYTKDGYYNNWWKYIATLDYVKEIYSNTDEVLLFYVDDEILVDYTLEFYSGEKTIIKEIENGENIKINGDCIKIVDNKLVAAKTGNASIKIYRDGKSLTYEIKILDKNALKVFALIISFIIASIFIGIIVKISKKTTK